jgi:hypothetical protein
MHHASTPVRSASEARTRAGRAGIRLTCGRFHRLPWVSCTMGIPPRRAHRFPANDACGWTHMCCGVSCGQLCDFFPHSCTPLHHQSLVLLFLAGIRGLSFAHMSVLQQMRDPRRACVRAFLPPPLLHVGLCLLFLRSRLDTHSIAVSPLPSIPTMLHRTMLDVKALNSAPNRR